MITRFCKWWLGNYLLAVYLDGWEDGVDQERLESDSTKHHVTLDEDGEPI